MKIYWNHWILTGYPKVSINTAETFKKQVMYASVSSQRSQDFAEWPNFGRHPFPCKISPTYWSPSLILCSPCDCKFGKVRLPLSPSWHEKLSPRLSVFLSLLPFLKPPSHCALWNFWNPFPSQIWSRWNQFNNWTVWGVLAKSVQHSACPQS